MHRRRTTGQWLLTSDGERIRAEHRRGAEASDGLCFVVAHGFTGSLERPDVRRIVDGLSEHGGVVSIDLRGHGRSSGRSTLGAAEPLDLDAAVRLARWHGYESVASVGFSLGGTVVLRQGGYPAPGCEVDAVVSVSAAGFWNYRGTRPMRILHRSVSSVPGRAALRVGYRTRVTSASWVRPYPPTPAESAARIAPRPLLVVHGASDGYFPAEHPDSIVRAAREGAAARGVPDATDYWWRPGMGHAEAAATEELVHDIGEWAAKAVIGGCRRQRAVRDGESG